uniref:Transforming growth factor alpha n=1 Tax=Canis lupus familiaris TaxID=9615 RepID=A0A8I3QEZ6_CANLF
ARPSPLQRRPPALKALPADAHLSSSPRTGVLLAAGQALENSTSALSARPPVAAAVVSHFNDCPDSHSQFCFHGTCRFLVQEDKPACVCHSGYVGARCEHADLLAVVAASQKKQAITALVVVSIVALAVLIIACVLIHCCQVRKHCEWCQALLCRHEKPSALLKGRAACCHSETGKGRKGPRQGHSGWRSPLPPSLTSPGQGPGRGGLFNLQEPLEDANALTLIMALGGFVNDVGKLSQPKVCLGLTVSHRGLCGPHSPSPPRPRRTIHRAGEASVLSGTRRNVA